jgi:hypothetical protein
MMKQGSREEYMNLFKCAVYPIISRREMNRECLDFVPDAYKYVLGKLGRTKMHYYDRHVKACSFCTNYLRIVRGAPNDVLEQRVADMAGIDAKMKKIDRELRAKGCLTTDDQFAYVHGELFRKKKLYLEEHIKKCKECKRDIEIITSMDVRGKGRSKAVWDSTENSKVQALKSNRQ